jgi:hypothetical protein
MHTDQNWNESDAGVLNAIDGTKGEAWAALVAYAAPALCKDNPRLLMEILLREAARRVTHPDYPAAMSAVVAEVLSECRLRLVIAE